MLTVSNLTKKYGTDTAVDDLSFTVPDGQVTGFLGPNGSGKSTTMRMGTGLEMPTSGRAQFDGVDFRELKNPSSCVGTLLDATWYHPGRTGRAHLSYMAALQGKTRSDIDAALDRVGLLHVAGKRVGGYSLGMKQRLGLACAMLNGPQHLLLDEPVNGLDPEGVHWMRDRIREFAAEGRAVLVSSHLLSEMQLTADRLVVIGRGRLIREGSMEEFLSASGAARIKVTVDDPAALMRELESRGLPAENAGPDVVVAGEADPADIAELSHRLGLRLSGLTKTAPSLEEAFLGATANDVTYRSY